MTPLSAAAQLWGGGKISKKGILTERLRSMRHDSKDKFNGRKRSILTHDNQRKADDEVLHGQLLFHVTEELERSRSRGSAQ